MKLRDLLPLSLSAILVNKARSALTMLGIIIGIAAVILMVSVGQAAQSYLLSQVASFGSDFIAVANGKGDEARGGAPNPTLKQTLTFQDFEKVKALPWPNGVTGELIARDLVSYGGEDKLTYVTGATPDDPMIFNLVMDRGTYFSENDLSSHARVVVLGSKIVDKLFGQEDPLGRTIKIAKRPFRVVGTFKPAGTIFFSDADDQVYIPATSAMDLYNKTKLDYIAIKAGTTISISQAKELIRVTLRDAHDINNPNGILSKDDFQVTTQEDAIQSVAMIGTILQILLGSIAGISLVVAGVGIMNIMYVTVTERTREIGLRKAIGARNKDILGQFLAEAIILTLTAGTIGVIVGILSGWAAIAVISEYQTGWTFAIPWNGAFLGFSVSVAIGVVFGYFPARKAAKLNSIEALHFE